MPEPNHSVDLAQSVLDFVLRPGYQPLKPRAIAKKLGLNKDGARALRKTIKRLVKRGKLSWGLKHLVLRPQDSPLLGKGASDDEVNRPPHPSLAKAGSDEHVDRPTQPPLRKEGSDDDDDREVPAPHRDQLIGVFSRTAQGNGFVRLKGGVTADERPQSIFIPASASRDASTGDVVAVKLGNRSGRYGRREGRIIEIVERETNQFVGTYFEETGQSFVRVDGAVFARPVPVGDPGAKSVRVDDKVVFEMLRFPTHAHDGEGVIVEVLGARGAPGVDTLSIIREYALPGEFPQDVLDEARRQTRRFTETVPPDRVDLTVETIITIDPVDARDFDDAISLVRLKNGHWKLGVHIADVSWFVEERTPLDREARNRATSCYLPDQVIPMLPELISNGLASLQPDKIRFAKTAFLEFTAEGVPVDTELANTAIRSKRRFTYEEVDSFLSDRTAWRGKLSKDVAGLVEQMHALAMILRSRRMQRGALELNLPEVKLDLDADGRVSGAHVVENTVSHQIIEEFMLSANEAVAEKLDQAGFSFLRRIHPRPTPRKMQALSEFVKELGLKSGSLEDRFALQKVLEQVRGKPEQQAVNYAVLRSLTQAVYSPQEEGHYALASDCYCHFTSPIRRYPDLTVHRLFDLLLSKGRPHASSAELVVLGEHCSERERRAEAAERELTSVKLLTYLHDKLGMEMDAVVTGVEDFGLFARGTELPAEGMIHISALENDVYAFDRRSHTLAGRKAGNTFRLGDMVRVQVTRVDLERRELAFRLVAATHRQRPKVEARQPKKARKKLPHQGKRRPAKRKRRK